MISVRDRRRRRARRSPSPATTPTRSPRRTAATPARCSGSPTACSGSGRWPRRWCRRSSSGSGSTPSASTSRAARCARSCSWTRTPAASTASASDSRRREREERSARAEIVADYDLDLEACDLNVAEQVREAMATLSDGERDAIELAYFGGHTYREVARILDQPEGTIKSRIRTGLTRLRNAARRPRNRRVMDRELTPEEIARAPPRVRARRGRRRRARRDRRVPRRRIPTRATRSPTLQVTASMLAHTGGPPPDGRLGEARVDHRERRRAAARTAARAVVASRSTPAPRSARVDRRWQWLAAAAAVVALAFGGLWLVDAAGDDRGRSTPPRCARRGARRAPGARHAALTDADGDTLATAVVTRDGTGYLTSRAASLRRGSDVSALGRRRDRHRSRSACSVATRSVVAFKAGSTDAEPRDHDRGRGRRAGERRTRPTRSATSPDASRVRRTRASPSAIRHRVARAPNTTRSAPPTPRRDAWQSTTRGCATCSSSRKTCTPTRWRRRAYALDELVELGTRRRAVATTS